MKFSATAKGTKAYFEKYPAASRPLGSTGLNVSLVGFGSYRISEDEPDHRDALKLALLSGVNLIDTSTNYTDGSSERLIGDVLHEFFSQGKLDRENIVVVTKAGYVQGANLKDAKRKIELRTPYPDMVEFSDDCWHCIAPQFLSDQLTNSLTRLRLDKVDVLLLHNPEYFLKTSSQRKVFDDRIEAAFRHLEAECEAGRIGYYGVSSNGFPLPDSKSEHVSVKRLVEIAEKIGAKKFAVVQMPLNLYESGGATVLNNGAVSAIEYARKMKLGVLVNRPFNSFARGKLVRLAPFATHDSVAVKGELHRTLGRAVELEKRLPKMNSQGLQWAHVLRDKLGEIDDVLIWRDLLNYKILPTLASALPRIPTEHQVIASEYRDAMLEFLGFISKDLESLGNQKQGSISQQLLSQDAKLSEHETLSRKALAVYLSVPGVTSVLVGMRKPEYVTDVLTGLGRGGNIGRGFL